MPHLAVYPPTHRLVALIAMMALLSGLLVAGPAPASALQAPGTTFISEIHYDNASTDVNEFVEITAPAGANLSGWSIVLYNGGSDPAAAITYGSQETFPAGTVIADQGHGYGTHVIDYPSNGLQNGGSDGIALLDNGGTVVELLSYEGELTAAAGTPAAGVASTDIGASESGSGAADGSVQRLGIVPDDYTWTADDLTNSKGAPNPGSVIDGTEIPGGEEPPVEELCDLDAAELTPIHDIQGPGADSPIAGVDVTTEGIVTADFSSGGGTGLPNNQGMRGFFIETAADGWDADPATSEGIFIFDPGTFLDGQAGDVVRVAGAVSEAFGVTEVTADAVEVCATAAPLPPALGLPLPLAPADRAATLEPLESMLVTHAELTVTEFFQLERFGEVRLSADGVLQTPTNVYAPDSQAREDLAAANAAATIILDDGRTGQNLNRLGSADLLPYVHVGGTLRIGDQLLGQSFVLNFGFNAWRLQPLDIDALTDAFAANRTRPRPETPPSVGGTLRVASFNVLNYFDGDGQGGGFPTARGATTPSELERQTRKLVDAIIRLGADVYGLIEIENDGGEFQATRTLVQALNQELGYRAFDFVDTGVIGTDEIKQAFIYRRATVRPVAEFALLTSAVDPRFDDTRNRPALAQTFLRLGSGERVTVVVNHLKSKGSGCGAGDDDPVQGNCNLTRTLAAEALADWLASNPTGVQSLGSIIIGDLNAYGREDPIAALEAAGFENQLVRFASDAPYSYTFDGQQGALDTALAAGEVANRITGAAAWHINADEVPAIDYLESVGFPDNQRFRTAEVAAAYYDPSAFRSSDHDPVIIGLDLGRSRNPGPI
jgi:hypothetical protein